MPMAKATHTTPPAERQPPADRPSSVFLALNDLETIRNALTCLHSLTVRAVESGDDLRPEAPGLLQLFREQDTALEFAEQELRREALALRARLEAGPAAAEEDRPTMRRRREDNIRQIMRDVDYAAVAAARGMPAGELLDILYALMDAPQKANAGAKTLDTMLPPRSERYREVAASEEVARFVDTITAPPATDAD